MLSILIPTYNYDVFELVSILNNQALQTKIEFEIIVLDDCSEKFKSENNEINTFEYCSYEVLTSNIGRSKIRNLLARIAKYENLLFLDADTIPIAEDFVQKYVDEIKIDTEIIYGGIKYVVEKPQKQKVFRWKYGVAREALTAEIRQKNPHKRLLTLNFLIKKSVFEKVKFNESIPNLRHEDTLFSYNLLEKNINVEHFDNNVYHLGIDNFKIAIKKENESLHALKYLIDNKLLPYNYIGLSKIFFKIKKMHLLYILQIFFKIAKKNMLKNLSSDNPSLFTFDIYRLAYLAAIYKSKS